MTIRLSTDLSQETGRQVPFLVLPSESWTGISLCCYRKSLLGRDF